MQNKIQDLRNHLFATLEGLMDDDKPMDLGRAEAVAKVAQVIINSAKVEVDFMSKLDSRYSTGFIPMENEPKKLK